MADCTVFNLSPDREAALLAATVGPTEELNSRVTLVAYSPEWSIEFRNSKERLQTELGPVALLIEHVGSTSVPGLSAKPIIDVVLVVRDSANEASYVPALQRRLGYELRFREPDWYEHRMLRLARPRVHLHVFSAGCEEVMRMISFRDHLREHPEDRLLYECAKIELASRTCKYMQAYADAKTDVISSILSRANASRPSTQ